MIKSNSPVKIPGVHYPKLPVLREEDHLSIREIAIKQRFDYVIVPCVQTGKDIDEVRSTLGEEGAKIHIVAKICNIEAV